LWTIRFRFGFGGLTLMPLVVGMVSVPIARSKSRCGMAASFCHCDGWS
jgi:hypothetical protein